MTTFSDQVYQYGGMPVSGELTTGNVFFVSSTSARHGNGKTPKYPVATLDEATNKCTANNGDIVYIMPNHAETIASATTWAPDVAGVKYIGIGVGADAPELTFSATGSSINASAGNNVFRNIRFIAGISAVVVGMTVTGTHVTIEDCMWDFSTTAYDFVRMLDLYGADYAKVLRNHFIAENATAGSNEAIHIQGSDFIEIKDNLITGDFARTAIFSQATDAVSAAINIANNSIYNDDTGSTQGGLISLRAAHTGMIARNLGAWLCKDGDSDTAVDPGSCLMFENYIATAIDEYGVATLIGTAST